MNKKKVFSTIALAGAMSFVLMGASECEGPSDPEVESDSKQTYKSGSKAPVDSEVYTITGEVSGAVNETTRQTEAAKGNAWMFGGMGQAEYFGPVEKGKGFVRLLVTTVSPSTDLATPENLTLLKVSDTKAKALLPGDIVTFKCRRQYEALAAVRDGEAFDKNKSATWELDYCRLASPQVKVK